MHPDADGFSNEVGLRDSLDETAVLAVVAVVTHHEIVAFRHRVDTVLHGVRIRDQYVVHAVVQVLDVHGLGRRRIRAAFQFDEFTVDGQSMVLVDDRIAGQPNNSLDVVDARVLGQTEYDDVTTLRRPVSRTLVSVTGRRSP